MTLTFKMGSPYFYLRMSKISLLFNEYEYHGDNGIIVLYRDYNLVCHYDIDLKTFKKKMRNAKKDFVKKNINNQKELQKYDKYFGDVPKMIVLIEKERRD